MCSQMPCVQNLTFFYGSFGRPQKLSHEVEHLSQSLFLCAILLLNIS